MLKQLEKFVNEGKSWLNYPEDWNSLKINYHHPYVDRLYLDKDGYRFYLHLIHNPDNNECLLHKHRWPSAIFMLHGSYEMGIGYHEVYDGSDPSKIRIAAKTIITPGSAYEMTAPQGLHYVKPLSDYSLSLMVSGPPYPGVNIKEHKDSKNLQKLDKFTQNAMFNSFKEHWPKERVNLFI